ncbi:3-hydroxyacyl-CoA dehydrogenase family protein, partial [Intestinimonas butyriciproducens]
MKVSDIKKVACVGGGVIGSSWAIQYAMRGLSVALYDINDEQLLKSRGQMEKSLDALVGHDAIAQTQKAEIVARVHPTTSMEEAVSDAQFIQESGPERLEIKRSILAQVEQYAASDALYASSTSGLLISEIVAEAAHPERC